MTARGRGATTRRSARTLLHDPRAGGWNAHMRPRPESRGRISRRRRPRGPSSPAPRAEFGGRAVGVSGRHARCHQRVQRRGYEYSATRRAGSTRDGRRPLGEARSGRLARQHMAVRSRAAFAIVLGFLVARSSPRRRSYRIHTGRPSSTGIEGVFPDTLRAACFSPRDMRSIPAERVWRWRSRGTDPLQGAGRRVSGERHYIPVRRWFRSTRG